MSSLNDGVTAVHLVLAVGAILLIAQVAGRLAVALLQPRVIGEIVAGVFLAPAILWAGGPGLLKAVLPDDVLHGAKLVGHVGLVLFVVGIVHEARSGWSRSRGRQVGWITAWAFLLAAVSGVVLAMWLHLDGNPMLRGEAPTPAFLLLMAVALSVTAVPVLARILRDRGILGTPIGKLAMTAAIAIDVAAWFLLALAIGLSSGNAGHALALLGVLTACCVGAFLVSRILRAERITGACDRAPRFATVTVAVGAFAASMLLKDLGLTDIFGAVLVGLALPARESSEVWDHVTEKIRGFGVRLVPVFFVVTGANIFVDKVEAAPWGLIVATIFLAVLGKVGGGLLGGMAAGLGWQGGLRLGILMNTRGLTELLVLHAGYTAGILSPMLYLALVVMAVVTTGMTGPLYSLVDWLTRWRTAASSTAAAPTLKGAE
ncbi:cation:proton antiporter [Micromonospora sp. NPDC051296]|uniref:cation:proton antiporter domain-containing protein n=1 Tax=Micromonospora sp. NPDC051296 TaxID=3155046 RepID=UPI003417DF01